VKVRITLTAQIAAVAVSCLVAGCSTYSLKELRHTTPKGTAYQNALSKLYMEFAIQEEKAYDWFSSMHFADKGLTAAYGNDVEPEIPDAWDVPNEVLLQMQEARKALLRAVNEKTKRDYPHLAARAVYYFDCWVEQQEENWQQDDIAECRNGLADVFERLGVRDIQLIPMVDPESSTRVQAPTSLSPMEAQAYETSENASNGEWPASRWQEAKEETPSKPYAGKASGGPMLLAEAHSSDGDEDVETTVDARLAHADAPTPPAIVSPYDAASGVETSSYMVFFDDNRTNLPDEGRKIVDEIVRSLQGAADYSVVIGASEHVEFAEKRAQSVREHLIDGGVEAESITVSVARAPDFMADSGQGDSAPIRHRVEIYLNQ
jgi:outer membrane protein OmpA-like peptidoglycan-associated protein